VGLKEKNIVLNTGLKGETIQKLKSGKLLYYLSLGILLFLSNFLLPLISSPNLYFSLYFPAFYSETSIFRPLLKPLLKLLLFSLYSSALRFQLFLQL